MKIIILSQTESKSWHAYEYKSNPYKECFSKTREGALHCLAEKYADEVETECPCGDESNHNNGDDDGCLLGGVIKHNL